MRETMIALTFKKIFLDGRHIIGWLQMCPTAYKDEGLRNFISTKYTL